MWRPDGDDAVDSGLASVASLSCSIVSNVDIVGGGVELLYDRPLIKSRISSVHVVLGW